MSRPVMIYLENIVIVCEVHIHNQFPASIQNVKHKSNWKNIIKRLNKFSLIHDLFTILHFFYFPWNWLFISY